MASPTEQRDITPEELERAKHYYGFFTKVSTVVAAATCGVLVLMAIFLL